MNQLEIITIINILVYNLGVFIDPYTIYIYAHIHTHTLTHTHHILFFQKPKWDHTVLACLFHKHTTVSILIAKFYAHPLLFYTTRQVTRPGPFRFPLRLLYVKNKKNSTHRHRLFFSRCDFPIISPQNSGSISG